MDSGSPGLGGNSSDGNIHLLSHHSDDISKLIHYKKNVWNLLHTLHLTGTDLLIKAIDVSYTIPGQHAVSSLHFRHQPLQSLDCSLRLSDYRCEKMRNSIVDSKLNHLRVHHNQSYVLRTLLIDDGIDEGVDTYTLSTSSGTCNDHMRHLGHIDYYRLSSNGLSKNHWNIHLGVVLVCP